MVRTPLPYANKPVSSVLGPTAAPSTTPVKVLSSSFLPAPT